MSGTIYLVSGSNRGIGLGLVKDILKEPKAVVFAGARDPSKATELQALATQYSDCLFVVKLVSADEESNRAVAEEIREKYGRVDTVIANAGICQEVRPAGEVSLDRLREHFEVNAIGPLMLFQMTQSLLRASKSPKFIPISSVGGSHSLIAVSPIKLTCYGSSKGALNWIAQRIHYENDWLVCFPFCPGAVLTDMLNTLIEQDDTGDVGERAKANFPLEQCTEIVIRTILNATREEHGGKFQGIDPANAKVVALPW